MPLGIVLHKYNDAEMAEVNFVFTIEGTRIGYAMINKDAVSLASLRSCKRCAGNATIARHRRECAEESAAKRGSLSMRFTEKVHALKNPSPCLACSKYLHARAARAVQPPHHLGLGDKKTCVAYF